MVCVRVNVPAPVFVRPPVPVKAPDCEAAPELLIVSNPPFVVIAPRDIVAALSVNAPPAVVMV